MSQITSRSCFKCGYFEPTESKTCPNCGRRLFSTTNVRIRGGMLLVIGAFLIAMMSYISYFSVAAYVGTDPSGSRFTGTREQFMGIAALFGALILFGFVSAVTGIWQLVVGRRNKVLVWLGLALGIALYAGALLMIWRY